MEKFFIGFNKLISFMNNEPNNINEDDSGSKDALDLITCSQDLSQAQKLKKKKDNKKCSCESPKYDNSKKIVDTYEETADGIFCKKCLTDLSKMTSKENFVKNWIGDLDALKSKLKSDHQSIKGIKGSRYKKFESKGVIWYLVENNLIHYARRLETWRGMREEGYLRHRSPKSLYNHLLHLLHHIKSLELPDDICEQFEKVAQAPIYKRKFFF